MLARRLNMVVLRRFSLVVAFYLLYAFSGNAEPVYNISRGVLLAGHVVDMTTTEIFLHRGYQEGNPLLRNRAARYFIASTGTAVIDRITNQMHPDHPRIAKAINFAFGGGRILVGVTWNLGGKNGSR